MGRKLIGLRPMPASERMRRMRERQKHPPLEQPPTDAELLARARLEIRELEHVLSTLREDDRTQARDRYAITAPLLSEIKVLKAEIARLRGDV